MLFIERVKTASFVNLNYWSQEVVVPKKEKAKKETIATQGRSTQPWEEIRQSPVYRQEILLCLK